MGDPFYVPVPMVLPGGRDVNYLSHQTEVFGDEMSSRIAEEGREVASLGNDIQRDTDEKSQRIEDIGREVDADETIPFPASLADEEFPDEEDEEEQGNGYNNYWPTEER
ncbi:hypothetical protein OS493_032384 [Desmophyllum pertusum]|uniref:Uncharacterized protein n=1 Tax=Desmophyllum pertusum TaxID=174260 RepID=A0A9W9YKT7_9CNID|nr:hypothetical protein OS493_032384 [Desmophyllum pertusum]